MDNEHVSYRLPVLSRDLLDSIIFAMEDQANFYFLDLKDEFLVREDEIQYLDDIDEEERENRFIPIPDWEPSDGFHLMEMFANRVRNPLYRSRLLAALQSGRGVFRKFKDTLSETPILERKWFSFRDEQLKRVVVSWYREQESLNQLLELSDEETELTEDILLEDFTFETLEGPVTEEIMNMVQSLVTELEAGSEEDRIASVVLMRHLELDELDHFYLAKAQDGSLAAFLSYTMLADYLVEVPLFGVKSEYRGLGLFRLLFDSFSRQMARFHYHKVVITLASAFLGMEKLFAPYGAKEVTKQLIIDTKSWNTTHPSSEEAFL
ncbi:UPF0158 family protein [uncultured Sphaerochaeta sp.]|uniref:UPF0158 family protein n=1 Tax=uncultured Sphaerochaeta sp. TaxID=886478 RepID=UPI0029CA7D03|nr:UPF0158 family protein [uncultured Sphaerochaeta sp.]